MTPIGFDIFFIVWGVYKESEKSLEISRNFCIFPIFPKQVGKRVSHLGLKIGDPHIIFPSSNDFLKF